jgi:hypothetical protein
VLSRTYIINEEELPFTHTPPLARFWMLTWSLTFFLTLFLLFFFLPKIFSKPFLSQLHHSFCYIFVVLTSTQVQIFITLKVTKRYNSTFLYQIHIVVTVCFWELFGMISDLCFFKLRFLITYNKNVWLFSEDLAIWTIPHYSISDNLHYK